MVELAYNASREKVIIRAPGQLAVVDAARLTWVGVRGPTGAEDPVMGANMGWRLEDAYGGVVFNVESEAAGEDLVLRIADLVGPAAPAVPPVAPRRSVVRRLARLAVWGLALLGAGTAVFLGDAVFEALDPSPLADADLAPAGVNGGQQVPDFGMPAQAQNGSGPLGQAWLRSGGGERGVSVFGPGGPVIGGGNIGAGDLQNFGLRP